MSEGQIVEALEWTGRNLGANEDARLRANGIELTVRDGAAQYRRMIAWCDLRHARFPIDVMEYALTHCRRKIRQAIADAATEGEG